jgi:hypothetical protein
MLQIRPLDCLPEADCHDLQVPTGQSTVGGLFGTPPLEDWDHLPESPDLGDGLPEALERAAARVRFITSEQRPHWRWLIVPVLPSVNRSTNTSDALRVNRLYTAASRRAVRSAVEGNSTAVAIVVANDRIQRIWPPGVYCQL